jgi:hypothetical protein
MAIFELPIKGESRAVPEDSQLANTSGYMNNIRKKDVLERKIRLSQRPGLDKVFAQQIGGSESSPIVFVGIVTSLD